MNFSPKPISESLRLDPRHAQCITAAENFAYALVAGDSGGHDRFHLDRVRHMALRLADSVGANPFVVAMAALLHDATDSKLIPDPDAGLAALKKLLASLPLSNLECDEIIAIVTGQSFSVTLNSESQKQVSLAYQVVQDADRLDALGAVGIARCFAYGGRKGQPLHDPALKPRDNLSLREYREGLQSSLNHFYEKLFRLRDKLVTPEARAIADQRHAFMETFVVQFLQEWDGVE
jgi:uncharacterized protein